MTQLIALAVLWVVLLAAAAWVCDLADSDIRVKAAQPRRCGGRKNGAKQETGAT